MLISGVLPIMSLYRLPHVQHAYSGHVIKCLLMYDHCRFAKLAPKLRLAKACPTMPAFQLVIVIISAYIVLHSYNDRRTAVLKALGHDISTKN